MILYEEETGKVIKEPDLNRTEKLINNVLLLDNYKTQKDSWSTMETVETSTSITQPCK